MTRRPFKPIATLACSILVVGALPAPVAAQMGGPGAGHPIVGRWQWTREANKCTEVYDYRRDGTVPVVSGTERTDNAYTISGSPDPRGFYKMTFRTVADHGGKDCADSTVDNTGAEVSNYILFNKAGDQHVVCQEPKLDRCIGPLKRVP